METVYPYHDQNGNVIYEAVREEPGRNGRKKDFTLRRVLPDGTRRSGEGVMDEVVRVPFLLPAVIEAIKQNETIYFVEGEKCAHALIQQGRIATTRSEGCTQPLSDDFLDWFRGAKLVVLADSDAQGRQAAIKRAGCFAKVANEVKLYDLDRKRMDGYDIADWLQEGNDINDLEAILQDVASYEKPVIEQPKTTSGPEAARIFMFADLLNEAVKRTESAVEDGPKVQASPWQPLNYALGGNVVHSGFSPGELVTWAAAPGVGKSAAVWMVADHAAAKHGRVVLGSLEMGEIDAVQRLISLYSGITTAQQRQGALSAEEWAKLAYVQQNLSSRQLAVIGRDGRDMSALQKSIEILASKGSLAAIVVDHVGVIRQSTADERRTTNDALESVIMRLGQWAIDYNCVVHMVMHLNRSGMNNGRPRLQDLRGGGNAEGHSNVIIFPFRRFPAGNAERRKEGELIVEKCRDGTPGSLPMRYIGERYMWVSTEENNCQPWFESE